MSKVKCYNCNRFGYMANICLEPKKPRDPNRGPSDGHTNSDPGNDEKRLRHGIMHRAARKHRAQGGMAPAPR
ncbi:uncharacterized protein FRV6_11736 [Fusarium oxysporum]|uniref:CCHC-type domain-containing protein n=1 Tax=Fusarium oxysporum TaxID=5507 RepID=A0A2H3U094_FUSOX|nr:uncharacterized protein FRV6_11736 [Fusarium oxysporum]